MEKLFAVAVLAAGAYALDDHCCHLWTGPDYTGDSVELCLPVNPWGEQLQ